MSGRGRGRGRGRGMAPPSVAASFASHTHTANTNPTSNAPPPRFPPNHMMEPKEPVNPTDIYAVNFYHQMHLALSQSSSPFYLKPSPSASGNNQQPPTLDRYSDRYLRTADGKASLNGGRINGIITDLSFFPPELHSIYNAELAARIQARTANNSTKSSFQDTLAKLKMMEQGAVDEQETVEEEEMDEAVYEEEELEDENDYGMSYFDNGEDYGDYDDGDEGPVY